MNGSNYKNETHYRKIYAFVYIPQCAKSVYKMHKNK